MLIFHWVWSGWSIEGVVEGVTDVGVVDVDSDVEKISGIAVVVVDTADCCSEGRVVVAVIGSCTELLSMLGGSVCSPSLRSPEEGLKLCLKCCAARRVHSCSSFVLEKSNPATGAEGDEDST